MSFKELFVDTWKRIHNRELFSGDEKILLSYCKHKDKPSSIYTNEYIIKDASKNDCWYFLDPTYGEYGQWLKVHMEQYSKGVNMYYIDVYPIDSVDVNTGKCFIDRCGFYTCQPSVYLLRDN